MSGVVIQAVIRNGAGRRGMIRRGGMPANRDLADHGPNTNERDTNGRMDDVYRHGEFFER